MTGECVVCRCETPAVTGEMKGTFLVLVFSLCLGRKSTSCIEDEAVHQERKQQSGQRKRGIVLITAVTCRASIVTLPVCNDNRCAGRHVPPCRASSIIYGMCHS